MIKPLNPEIIPFVLSEIHQDKNGGNIIGLKYDTMKPSDKCIPLSLLMKDLDAWMKEHGKKVKELCYFDLMADYHYCCGLYLFFTRTEGIVEIQYIGKTTSRAIVDRIGAHLDLRDSGFLNCLIKRVAKVVGLKKG